MALITCPDCSSEVSDKAPACPRCGHPFTAVVTAASAPATGDLLAQRALSKHSAMTANVPKAQRSLLLPGEEALHFAYISQKGGCMSGAAADQWLLVSNQRVLYAATVAEQLGGASRYTSTSGGIPLHKISFVGTKTQKTTQGCSSRVFHVLVINSSGGSIDIVVNSNQEARRTQALIESIIQ